MGQWQLEYTGSSWEYGDSQVDIDHVVRKGPSTKVAVSEGVPIAANRYSLWTDQAD